MTSIAQHDPSPYRRAAPTEARYQGALGRYFERIETAPVVALVEGEAASALDLGCGTGRLFDRLVHPGRLVIGVDISAEMLTAAGRNHPGGVALMRADFAHLPLAGASLDNVVALGAFHLTGDLAPVFAEVARIVRPGGRFVFTCWNARPWSFRRLFMGRDAAAHRIEDVARALGAAGFSAHEAYSTFFVPPNLFWVGYRALGIAPLRALWVAAAIAVNRLAAAIPWLRGRGGELIIRAWR
jgi:SAM-dependent methyltransferase